MGSVIVVYGTGFCRRVPVDGDLYFSIRRKREIWIGDSRWVTLARLRSLVPVAFG